MRILITGSEGFIGKHLADLVINTSRFNVHELREFIGERFGATRDESGVLIYVTSFGFRHGVPTDSDLVFDVRFLENPFYRPELRELNGQDAPVRAFVLDQPVTRRFLRSIGELLAFTSPNRPVPPCRVLLPDLSDFCRSSARSPRRSWASACSSSPIPASLRSALSRRPSRR